MVAAAARPGSLVQPEHLCDKNHPLVYLASGFKHMYNVYHLSLRQVSLLHSHTHRMERATSVVKGMLSLDVVKRSRSRARLAG